MAESTQVLMIVEDDLATRRALGAIFSRDGWQVCLATTAAEAAALLDHGLVPDFLILDLMLPDGDGVAILGRVRRAGLATRVIVCSGTSDPARWDAVRGLHPDLTLTKPIDADVLLNLCENWSRLG
jgi:DNA-binding response OmpR family regulator